MIIDLVSMEEKAIPSFKGGEKELNTRMFSNSDIKIMKGRLVPGASIGLHTHDTSSEIIFILSGKADYIMDDSTEVALPGQAHYCPKGHSHSMINNYDEDLIFYAVVPEL